MIKTKINDKLWALLKNDEVGTLNLKGIIENSNPDIYTNEAMTGLWLRDGYFSYLYTEDEAYLDEIIDDVLEELKATAYVEFSGSNKFSMDYMSKHQTIHWVNPCRLLVVRQPSFDEGDIIETVDSLRLEDAEFVNDHYTYKSAVSLGKIREAILNRPSSCVRIDGKPVSYAALHEDNSIGYMYTLEEHRQKGYAHEVTKDITLKTLKSGRTPYIQIHPWNEKSLRLAQKSGFEICEDVYWFAIINPDGCDLKMDLEKYKKIYSHEPSHLSTKLNMSRDFRSLDVAVKDMKDHIMGTIDEETYRIDYIYENEIYYLASVEGLSNEILRSILVEFLTEEDYICLVKLDEAFDATGFRQIND